MNLDVEADMLREGAVLTDGATQLLDPAQPKRHLSERRAETVLRVARTIADLAATERVEAKHVAEALGLQRTDDRTALGSGHAFDETANNAGSGRRIGQGLVRDATR